MGRGPVALTLSIALLAGGCGGAELTSEENVKVSGAFVAFYATVLDGSQYGDTLQGVDDLIRICRAKPDAMYDGTEGEVTMRQAVEDAAGILDRYRGELADRLARAAEAGCK